MMKNKYMKYLHTARLRRLACPRILSHYWSSIVRNHVSICNMTLIFPDSPERLALTAFILASISPVRAWITMPISTICESIISSVFITKLSLLIALSSPNSWLLRVATKAIAPSEMRSSARQVSRWQPGWQGRKWRSEVVLKWRNQQKCDEISKRGCVILKCPFILQCFQKKLSFGNENK